MAQQGDRVLRGAYRPHKRVTFATRGPTMTKQSEAEACDINGIMKRYENDGILNHLMKHEGRFGDFIDAQEYHEAMTAVVLAQEMFEDLPAAVRERFANDPASFLQFAQDPANASELVKMGLATERPVETAPEIGRAHV